MTIVLVLLMGARLLLADEPTGVLDSEDTNSLVVLQQERNHSEMSIIPIRTKCFIESNSRESTIIESDCLWTLSLRSELI